MLRTIRAGDGAALADALAERLRTPLPDPLATEEVVVRSRGAERWLSQHLSRVLGAGPSGDGVCANVAFPFPDEVVRRIVRAAGGPDPRRSAWVPARLVWPLLELVEGGLGAWADPLTAPLRAQPDARLAVLRTVADRYDRLAAHRPDLVLAWLDGDDVDGAGTPLDDPDRWQPRLLRELRAHVDQPTLAESAVAAAAGLAGPGDLPPRLSLFGFTALPAVHLSTLVALADHVDVDLYLLHPSPALWTRSAAVAGSIDPRGLPLLPTRDADVLPVPHNRLLRSWGRDVRELQAVVQTIAPDAPARDVSRPRPAPTTALGALQAAVADDRAVRLPVGVGPAPDESVQVHACHGRARQVQVLRDEILRLLAADPTLEPRDVVVMCPDVEAYAPLVQAHLAVPADDPDGRPDLRVRLADRALRQTNPLMRVLDELLRIASGRLTATRLLDLVGSDPVRRRFGLSEDDLERLAGWAADSGMRWGLDVEDRRPDGVQVPDGTVDAGLSRILLGAALADEDLRTVDGITPLDDVEGADVIAAGRLAELVDRLRHVTRRMRTPQPLQDWVALLVEAADLLLLEPYDEPWQRTQLIDELREVEASAEGRSTVPLSLAEVRSLLADRLRGRPSWANHRTGDLTVCTLVPMRSVPHRVVCLLGMDDEDFPRRSRGDGDDLLARHPRVGDHDPRTEDRQLLLDAVMAAGDHLLITYAGVDERTGLRRPPCTPVAELVRTLRTAGIEDPVTRHPLHAHSPRAFTPGRPGFDPQAHEGAQVVPDGPADPAPAPAPVTPPATVELAHLHAFVRGPVAHHYRQTAGAYVPDDPEAVDDQVPLTMDGLLMWGMAEDVLDHDARDEADRDRIVAVQRGRGGIPPGTLPDVYLERLLRGVDGVQQLADGLAAPRAAAGSVDVDVQVAGRRVVGVVDRLDGVRRVAVSYSKVTAKQIIAAWVDLLALTAHDPDRPWEALVVGRHEQNKVDKVHLPHAVRIEPLGPTAEVRRRTAAALLGDLLDLHDDGLREPLVVPPKAACAYAMTRVVRRGDADAADARAADEWDHDEWRQGQQEADAPAHVLLLGDVVPYDVLRRDPPRAVDVPLGGDAEPHRFGALAMRLWSPVLSRCRAVGG